MNRIVIFSILLLSLLVSCSKKEKQSSTDLQRIHSLQLKADTIMPDSAYPILKKIQHQTDENPNFPDSIKAENNYLLGKYFRSKSQVDSAAVYFQNSIDYVNSKPISQRQGYYFMDAWNAYSDLEYFTDCFVISKKFESLLDSEDNYWSLAWVYYWEKSVYMRMKDYQNALKATNSRVQLARKWNSEDLPGALVSEADLRYTYLNDKKGAFFILDSLIANEHNLTDNFKRQVYGNKGVYLYYEGDYHGALKHYLRALENSKKDPTSDRNSLVSTNFNNIAEVHIDLKDYKTAAQYLDSVKQLGISDIGRRQQRSLLKYQFRLASETNDNMNEVLKVWDSLNAYQDKTYKDKFDQELLALKKADEKQKILLEEKQVGELRNLKLRTRSLVGLVVLVSLILIGTLLYGRRKLKFDQQSLQMQQRLLRSQMNPHFTYNTLYAIKNEIKKDQKSAENYILKFSRLLRLVLENSMSNYVQIEKELESIRKYIELQLMRMPGAFTYKIVLDNFEEDELIFIPPMLLQPIIENSIEHGFAGIKYRGNLILSLKLDKKVIHCRIEDNGKGFVEAKSALKTSASTQLISDFLKKSTKKGFELINKSEVDPLASGVIVTFSIPYKLNEHD